MPDLIVIGFMGKSCAGKTTAAKYLQSIYGGRIISLSSPLKLLAQDLFDFTYEELYGPQKVKEANNPKIGGMPTRDFMERLGMGVRKRLGENTWLSAWENEVICHYWAEKGIKSPIVVFCDDVRLENEVNFFNKTISSWELTKNIDSESYLVKLVRTDLDRATYPSEQDIGKLPNSIFYRVIESHATEDAKDLKNKVLSAAIPIFSNLEY